MRGRNRRNLKLSKGNRGLLLLLGLCLWAVQTSIAAPPLPQQATSVPCGTEAAVQGQVTGTMVTAGAQPGATDPVGVPAGRYQMFPDQGLGVFQPGEGPSLQTLFYQTDTDSTLSLSNSSVVGSTGWASSPISAVAGRILTPDHDNLVYAQRMGPASGTEPILMQFVQEGLSITLPAPLLPRQTDSTDFIAIAQADLDKVQGPDGNFHNEVVVAHVSGESTVDGATYYTYNLDVLNYASGNISSPDVTSASFSQAAPVYNNEPQQLIHALLPVDNILAVAIGDFNGDGYEEIAVAALGNYTLSIHTYSYQTVNGVHSLNLLSSQSWETFDIAPAGLYYLVGTLSAEAEDLDGEGADELVLGYAKWGIYRPNVKFGTFGVGALIFKYSGATPVIANNSFHITANRPADLTFAYQYRPRVQLALGQFVFLPPTYPYGRRQLVLAYNDSGIGYTSSSSGEPLLHIAVVGFSEDLSAAILLGRIANLAACCPGPTQVYSIAAGGFQGSNTLPSGGNGTAGAPISSLAVSYWLGNPTAANSTLQLATFQVEASSGAVLANVASTSVPLTIVPSARLPVVAYDLQGKSLYLGLPAHLSVAGAARTDVILQEPPKHVYWDEKTQRALNLTRSDGNNVHLYNSTASSFSTSSLDESSWDGAGSSAATVGETVGNGQSFQLGPAGSPASADLAARSSYDYRLHEAGYDSGYTARQIGTRSNTDHDDYLSGETQTFDVWRYRAYGTPQSEGPNSFYELVLPGPKAPFAGSGLNFDWYQPVHENGNILSYPAALGAASNPYTPSDLGTITLPDGTTLTEPLVPAVQSFFDGTGDSTQLTYSSAVSQGQSFKYSHMLAESADVKANYTSSAIQVGASGEIRTCGSSEFYNSNSWGNSATSSETSKTVTAITLNRAVGVSSYAYPFYPVVYTTQDGTLKMSFAVPNPGQKTSNPANFLTYAQIYGSAQDPALNLPRRFDSYVVTPGQTGWLPNLRADRKQMRGLFFRQPDVNPATGTYDFLSANPTAGDTVRIEARVYNYSTSVGTYNVPVQFEAIPYDSSYDSESCPNPINAEAGRTFGLLCPASARTIIGQTTIPALNPLQWTCLDGTDDPNVTGCAPSVYVDWDTSQFASSSAGTTEYRIYVVLNADGSAGPEIYGWEGNPVRISTVASSNPMAVTAPGNQLNPGDYVTIGGVKGLSQANGIFQVGSFSNHGATFTLNTCQPSPPCAAFSAPGRTPYQGGGTVTLLDPGQNNEGYGYIGITTPTVQALDSAPVTPQDYLEFNSLEGLRTIGLLTGSLAEGWTIAYLYDHQQLRFTAYSNTIHADAAEALLFDGDPASGAPAIAEKTIHPGNNGPAGESVWFDWQPTTPGLHRLFAVLMEGTGPQQKIALDVNVTNGNPASQ